MKRSQVLAAVGIMAILLGITTLGVQAQTGGYSLDWWTVDNGGAISAATAGYSLSGSLGQFDAALWQGSNYTLSGGFWTGNAPALDFKIYLPLVLRSL